MQVHSYLQYCSSPFPSEPFQSLWQPVFIEADFIPRHQAERKLQSLIQESLTLPLPALPETSLQTGMTL